MKKFLKFLASLVAIASVVGGAYYVVKNFILNDDNDDFDDFDDDFDDFDDVDTSSDNRGYVTLNSGEDESDNEQNNNDSKKTERTESNTTDEKEDDNDFLIEE